jgi:hypothetical protein
MEREAAVRDADFGDVPAPTRCSAEAPCPAPNPHHVVYWGECFSTSDGLIAAFLDDADVLNSPVWTPDGPE